MNITSEQLSVLDALKCERLSSDWKNMRLVETFENYKNSRISDTLKNEAFEEDETNKVAYYVIKDKEEHILFFFSLKCGLLYDEFIEGEKLEKLRHLYEWLLKMKEDGECSDSDKDTIDSILESVRSKKGLKKADVARIVNADKDSKEFDSLFDENTKNVGRTFAGIEIVHFCVNDEMRYVWEQYGFDHKIGTVVFWYFIVPKVQELMKIAGCEYIFLFAADCSENEELINYYIVNLNFMKADEHSAAIPLYDFTCKFMYQETQYLESGREKFLSNFNRDKDAV